jgi:sigma-B regulation protein RsbU (phosphoserine phosphatase)
VSDGAESGPGASLIGTRSAWLTTVAAQRMIAVMVFLVTTGVGAAHYATGTFLIAVAWLAVGPLLGSLVLPPRVTAVLAGWAALAGLALSLAEPGRRGGLMSHLSVLVLVVAFAVANSALRTAAQRRLRQVRAVARVAQAALLRPTPPAVRAGRLACRYISAAAEARVGGDVLEVVADAGNPRWLIGDTRGKGLPAVRLASVAMTSFRDASAQPGLSLAEIARVVDRSVARAAGDEDFVTALFAELDPGGWLQLVNCGHPPPLMLTSDGELRALTPAVPATPLGLHPSLRSSTYSVGPGDRLIFYTDGLLEARDRAGRYFRLEDCLDVLRRPDLEAAADDLLARLLAHAGHKLGDDVAVLLLEVTADPADKPESSGSSLMARRYRADYPDRALVTAGDQARGLS